jgi:hypothetical protein
LLRQAVKALTLRSEAPAPEPKKKQKETGRGSVALARRAKLKQAWHGSSARLAVRHRPGRIVLGLAKAAVRAMEDFNRAMKEAFLSPHQLAREREHQRGEAADRQDNAELAERLRQIDDWFEEQRRRRMEAEAGAHNAGDAAFRNAATVLTAPELPGWLREFFEAEPAGNNLLDPANPARDLVLGANDGMPFDADADITGPALDLR